MAALDESLALEALGHGQWRGRADPRYEANTIACTRLAIAARAQLFGWAREGGIEFDQRQQGILHVCRDKAGFEHGAAVSRLLAQGGLQRRAVTPLEMRALEPALAARRNRASLTTE